MATMVQMANNLLLFLIVFSWSLSVINAQEITTAASEESETIWSSCNEEFKYPMAAKDVKVYVNQCPPVNGNETRCKLTKGIDAVLKIQFSKYKKEKFFFNQLKKFKHKYFFQEQSLRYHQLNG